MNACCDGMIANHVLRNVILAAPAPVASWQSSSSHTAEDELEEHPPIHPPGQ